VSPGRLLPRRWGMPGGNEHREQDALGTRHVPSATRLSRRCAAAHRLGGADHSARAWSGRPPRPTAGQGVLVAVGGLLCLGGCGHSSRGVSAFPVRPQSAANPTVTKSGVAVSPRLLIRASRPPWSLPAAVYRTVAVATGGRIFVLGGHDPAESTINDVYELDAQTGRSRTAGTLVLPTHGAAAAVLGGRILLFGGASTSVHDAVQEFDPVHGTARLIGHLPEARADVTAAVAGNSVVLAGGFDGVEPQSDVWTTVNGRTFRSSDDSVKQCATPQSSRRGTTCTRSAA
jgi:hypothetical protein